MTDLTNHDAERMWLGTVYCSAGRVLADTDVRPDDLQHHPHRLLLRAFTDMWHAGEPFDEATVLPRLGADAARTQQSLFAVINSQTVPQWAHHYARILLDLSTRRALLEAATRLAQAATGDLDTEELTDFARAQIDAATATRGARSATGWDDLIGRALDRWTTPVTDAVPTGWRDLDGLLSGRGLRPGHITVIGARTGVGKSLVATMLAGSAASRGHGVYFASVEMSADELTDRIAAAATGIPLADLSNGLMTADQLADAQDAVERVLKYPLTVDDTVQTVAHLRRGVRAKTRQPGGLGLVIVDYLQLMVAGAGRDAPRQEQVSAMSRAIKLMAREHHVPVVLLAQLNRDSVRDGKPPAVHHLRESGAVEQDADEIILLHRDDDDPDLAGMVQLHLAKNRHGPTGKVLLRWQPEISRITNLRLEGIR
jgi:replicative DNA helicase